RVGDLPCETLQPSSVRSRADATALFAALTLSFGRVVMKSVRLAITRCPARAVRTYTLRGVGHWRGGVQVYLGRLRRFQLRARVGSTITPSPMPPHQTGRDHFGHPASRPCSPRGVRKRCTTVPWSWYSPAFLKKEGGNARKPLPRRLCFR